MNAITYFQHKDLARENERAAEIAADLASQMSENHAPILGNTIFKCDWYHQTFNNFFFYILTFYILIQLIHALKSIVVLDEFVKLKILLPNVSAYQNVHNKAIHVEWFAQTKIKHGIQTVKFIVNVVSVIRMIHVANRPN